MIIHYLRKIIPHNSPVRLWYTRIKNVISGIVIPVKKSDLQNMQIIGVTGTDGKTTTVEMIAHILNELKIPNISASSYAIKMNGKILKMSKRTTSSAYETRKILRQAIQNKIKVIVIEVSSHSLVQWRLFGIKFDVAILTNITHEHLNFHKTIENYANAKKLLFTKYLKNNGIAILPTNDAFGKKWLHTLNTPCTFTFTKNNLMCLFKSLIPTMCQRHIAHAHAYDFQKHIRLFLCPFLKFLNDELPNTLPYSPEHLGAYTDTYGTVFLYNNHQYTLPMLGNYNAGNALAAAIAINALRIPKNYYNQTKTKTQQNTISTHDSLMALENFEGVPGRMQIVPHKTLTCIVDFALTEKAMSSALSTAGEIAKSGKVILVFGASGGQHDASVHPGLAKSAALGSDIAIVTDDEPYDGDPDKIRSNLIKYIKNTLQENPDHTCEYHNIADRKEAIRKAISLAKNGDVVIVTGMGHYTSRTVNGKEVPWSDYEAVKDALLELS